MITNPYWHKPKIKPLSSSNLTGLYREVECMESCEVGEIDADTCLEIEKHIYFYNAII